MSEKTVRLSNLLDGEEARIINYDVGRKATQRLSGLGLTIGTEIKLISHAPFGGPYQIKVRGTKLALGQGLCNKIYVRKV